MRNGLQVIKLLCFTLSLFAIGWAPRSANAAIINVFNNDASGWAASVGSFQTEDFSSSTLVSGLSVTSTVGVVNPGGFWSDVMVLGSQTTTWSFSSPTITGFGGNWDLSPNGAGIGIAFTVTFLDNTTQLVSVEVPNSFTGEFFGFVSDTPFKSVLETGGTQGTGVETYNLDNLVFGPSTSTTPLPAALPLFATGVGALGLLGWRRKKKAAALGA
jgi:hypothetical protein